MDQTPSAPPPDPGDPAAAGWVEGAPRRPVGSVGSVGISLRDATRAWTAVSLRTFGGPAGQIAVMHREFVDERRWIGERRFLHALSFCTVLPGPEAQQLAIYLGWLLNGTPGGLIAGVLFVLPGYVALMVLSVLYVGWGATAAVGALLAGLGPAVIAIVADAVVRLARRALRARSLVLIAIAAFVALYVFAVPFPLVIVGAAVTGLILERRWPGSTAAAGHAAANDGVEPAIADGALHDVAPSWRRAARIVGFGVPLWLGPVAVAAAIWGGDHVLVDQGRFFAGTALVTFGGAYAVLSFVADRAVGYGWLGASEMTRGLGFAETTPGPLIMVVQFVGFVGAYRQPGDLNPWVAGVLGATLVVWVTFVPCFLLVFLGAPYIERLRGNRALAAALTGVSAAVVGVIANLSVFFAVHTLFSRTRAIEWDPVRLDVPEWSSLSPAALAVALVAGWLLIGRKWSVLRVLGVAVALGAALHLA